MASITLKKSSVAAKAPLATDLAFGELALNYADGKLYYLKSDGTTIDFFQAGSSFNLANATGTLSIAKGGTGATTAPAAQANLLGYTATTSTGLATVGAGGAAGTATISFAAQASAPYAVGSYISVQGITPTGYNGRYQVTACTTTSVSYASATTGSQTVAGSIAQVTALTNTSSFYQYTQGSTVQSAFSLPDTSTLQQGWTFRINTVTSTYVYTSTGAFVTGISGNLTYYFTCVDTTVNTAAAWRIGVTEVSAYTGSGNMVLSSGPTITGALNFTGSTTSAANFGTAVTTAQILVGGTSGTGLIGIGRSSFAQPVQIAYGAISTVATASGTTSSISGTVLTVGGTTSGTFSIGMAITGTGVLPNTYIVSLGTGVGQAGTYNINQTQTVASTTITGTSQKSVDIGVGGASGSSTVITLGSSTSGANSTTNINGTLNAGYNLANYIQVAGAATTVSPTLSVLGLDTNIDLTLAPKGTGKVLVNSPLQIDTNLVVDTFNLTTTATTANQVLTALDATVYRAVKFLIRAVDATSAKYHTTEILAVHNGTTANSTEYASVNIGGVCATFDVDYSSNTIRLLTTPASANSTVFTVAVQLLK